MPKRFLTTKEAAGHLGLQPVTLECWRSRGGGPAFVKMGRAVRYRSEDLDAWVESRIRSNTCADDKARAT
jgi:excisionase family DNA binding protein